MKTYLTLETICAAAIKINPTIRSYNPQTRRFEYVNREVDPRLEQCYCTSATTLSFISDSVQYVIPYTRDVMNILKTAGFQHEFFNVPFSAGDYPADMKEEWDALQADALAHYKKEFEDDCAAYCDERGVHEIAPELLQACFRIPDHGVRVKQQSFECTYYPEINCFSLEGFALTKIGRYCAYNDVIAFVYRDGGSYVTCDYAIVDALHNAGFTQSSLFVPFSSGEKILNPELAAAWEKVRSAKKK